jgi:hypothetical protein
MATVSPQEFLFGGNRLVVWAQVNGGDTCTPWNGLEWPDKTVTITGSVITAVSIAGTNDSRAFTATYDSAATLTDATTGTAISVGSGVNPQGTVFVIKENPLAILPIVTTGTRVDIRITCAKKR